MTSLCILLPYAYYFLVHTTCSCRLLVRAYYLFVHTTCWCILLVCAYYLCVHTACLCIPLVRAYYLFVHTACLCILLVRAYYLLRHLSMILTLDAHWSDSGLARSSFISTPSLVSAVQAVCLHISHRTNMQYNLVAKLGQCTHTFAGGEQLAYGQCTVSTQPSACRC